MPDSVLSGAGPGLTAKGEKGTREEGRCRQMGITRYSVGAYLAEKL